MFSRTLSSLRISAGLSREALAEFLHISPISYYFFETGRRQPSLEILYSLSEFYHVSLDFLFGHAASLSPPLQTLLKKTPRYPTQSELLSILGLKLKMLRRRRNLTQSDVAARFHISRVAFSYYERGLRQPPPEILFRFASFFDVSIDWLCGKVY